MERGRGEEGGEGGVREVNGRWTAQCCLYRCGCQLPPESLGANQPHGSTCNEDAGDSL